MGSGQGQTGVVRLFQQLPKALFHTAATSSAAFVNALSTAGAVNKAGTHGRQAKGTAVNVTFAGRNA